jgi:hypothetical protein
MEKNTFVYQASFVNEFGEKMELYYTKEKQLFFFHEDCNDNFENIEEIVNVEEKKFNKGLKFFKYILDKEEQKFLNNFINMVNYQKEIYFLDIMGHQDNLLKNKRNSLN